MAKSASYGRGDASLKGALEQERGLEEKKQDFLNTLEKSENGTDTIGK